MGKYYDNLSEEYKEYYHILSKEFPSWLEEYIETEEMQRIGRISMDCGNDYTDLFPKHPWHSNLEHSIGVALIIWNFTKDKKQTLAGLFHDIATPVFKHCIDFMNGDSRVQESTEERTKDIIMNSEKIMALLKRDNITVDEVCDYKIYPIADNDSPKLSADRFEYNFGCGYFIHPLWNLDLLKKCYDDVIILKNENNILELGFQHLDVAEEYIHMVSKLWPWWINDEDRIAMQFLADTCKKMNEEGYLTIDDLYTLSEKEVIDRIRNCEDKDISRAFKKFEDAKKCYTSDVLIEDKYCIKVISKRRYLNPLVCVDNTIKRAYDASEKIKKDIDNYMKISMDHYVYFDFQI